jgi:aspartyl-tRNA(Asn)/glutamyl-tRNA(Gln) amidotransferase subunit B
MSNKKYETIIGLETHIQLGTKSKAFCGDDARFGGAPNTHVSAISLGHPGTLPKLNKTQIEYAVRLSLALNAKINLTNNFDRKNYFYTDLPKGYQITQDNAPISVGGYVPIKLSDGTIKNVELHHIHMEEDAGKSIHDLDSKNSMVDLNRAGVPLVEVVSEPDLRSGEEVDVFMNTLRRLVRWLDISDGNMEQGSMRCDCNVSIRPMGSQELFARCEVKNMNSMRFARKAIDFETKRQIKLVEKGEKVRQQTLQFDRVTGTTSPLRDKEDAHDYRYFPDPDLPPVVITPNELERIKSEMPALPWELYAKFTEEFKLSDYDATILTEEKNIAFLMLELSKKHKNYKACANLLIDKVRPYLAENDLVDTAVDFPVERFAELLDLVAADKVSNSVASQKLFPAIWKNLDTKVEELAEKMNLIQSSDSDFLSDLADELLEKYPDKVTVYRKGKKGLIGFFMGELMKLSKGKANPKEANAILRQKLDG